jgi:hypothetical protein
MAYLADTGAGLAELVPEPVATVTRLFPALADAGPIWARSLDATSGWLAAFAAGAGGSKMLDRQYYGGYGRPEPVNTINVGAPWLGALSELALQPVAVRSRDFVPAIMPARRRAVFVFGD